MCFDYSENRCTSYTEIQVQVLSELSDGSYLLQFSRRDELELRSVVSVAVSGNQTVHIEKLEMLVVGESRDVCTCSRLGVG